MSKTSSSVTFTLFISFLLLSSTLTLAQKRANNWCFSNYGLNFNTAPVSINNSYIAYYDRGMGIISDDYGQLQLYTDGFNVWNRNHSAMPNGYGLLPNSSSSFGGQESMILPKPGDDTKFYIFTVDVNGVFYSEVDMLLAGGLGNITTKGVKLLSSCKGLSAIYHENQQDIWFITHEYYTGNYYTIKITNNGIEAPVIHRPGGKSHTNYGQLKFSPDGKKIAVSYSSPDGGISLFDFNPGTGTLSNPQDFAIDDLIEGIEFSSDATKMYATALRQNMIVQYDISRPTFEQIRDSRRPVGNRIVYNSMRDFQLAPDGKIYITKGGGGGGTGYLGVIENPNDDAVDVIFKENGFYLQGKDSFAKYTSNFIQNYFFKTSFSFDNNCQSVPINFRVTNLHLLDSVKWSFGEGTTSTLLNPQFKYLVAGDYTVELKAYYSGKMVSVSRQVKINPYTSFNLGADATLCKGTKIAVDDRFVSYQWNRGDTTRWIRTEESGAYILTATNQFNCSFKDTINITIAPSPNITLPDTVSISPPDSVKLTPGDFESYKWNTGKTTSSIYVNKEGWYSILVKNRHGCTSAKSVFVTKNNIPIENSLPKWIRLNPTPTGVPGNDMFFLDDQRGFIVTGSELLVTKNGGELWEKRTTVSGRRVSFSNNIGYVIGDRGTVFKSTHFGEQWNRLNINSTDNLNAITVLHEDSVFITSDNKLFFTFDGGQSWTQRSVNITGINIEDSYFLNMLEGHAVCTNGRIIKTQDGGITWRTTLTSNSIPSNYFRVKFTGAKTGYATREHSSIYKTIDGGETWKEIVSSLDAGFAIQFLNEKNGFLAGEHGAMHKTTDGGVTWKWIGFNGRIWANDLYAVFFIDENIGFASGLRGRIVKTLDGGRTWKEYAPTYNNIEQTKFISHQTGYFLSGDTFFKTTDAGVHWENLGAPIYGTYKFDFVNDQVGYTIAGGSVYGTIDNGKNWKKTHASAQLLQENLNTIHFINESTGFVSGGYNWTGTFKTEDRGVTWKSVSGVNFGQIQFLTSSVGFARNIGNYYNRIYKTVDGGISWKVVYEIDDDITSFHFVDEAAGYFVGDPNVNYKTIDGGATWQKITIPYEYYKDVKFISRELGYILDEEGQIFKTTDGGASWKSELISYGLSSLSLQDKEIYAAGEFGNLFRSSISLSEFIKIDDISLINLSDSSAAITSHVKSFINVSTTPLLLGIGTTPGEYGQKKEVEQLNGYVDKTISYNLTNLKPETTYYCIISLSQENQSVKSSEFKFTTPKIFVVTEVEAEDEEIRIYPNPTTGVINIKATNAESFRFEIKNALGSSLLDGMAHDTAIIDISMLSSGVYIVCVDNDHTRKTIRIVKK